ncbi:hypothetical protein G6F70_000092 [Rhizopus microsporus]|nr:hypothetical protein G6F71_003508 [Rhizopus microsporus]KAG1204786.1 hypothetical protein G6F70_000092 [Rhizopus microsporus]KAG1209507.1 hypothetical protein G6F69_006306 [Rhizopus microsporus]KAG1236190.1 hypothetical protein G6F67_002160 [Rhizopus microsporus]KAG1265244.1 hypothetical protein G6F68_003719 [Rhizopus microsporus]
MISHSNEQADKEEEQTAKEESYYIPKEEEPISEEYGLMLDNNSVVEDDPFYLANKTFYTTCHKISRQNNPSFRKKPPYTFLENWLIHSVFSKSQQILLRFPVIHPKVMMTEGDFIYTPHQMVNDTNFNTNNATNHNIQQPNGYDYYSNEYVNHNDEEDDDDDYDYYDDDTFIIGDEGVIVMSAPAPDTSQFVEDEESIHTSSLIMDENTWMGHSKYNGNGLTLHVVNPDLDEDDEEERDKQRRYTSFHTQLQVVKEEEEEEDEENYRNAQSSNHQAEYKSTGISMSPEILNWYRSADLKSMKSAIYEEQQQQPTNLENKERDNKMNDSNGILSHNNHNSNSSSSSSSSSSNSSSDGDDSSSCDDGKSNDDVSQEDMENTSCHAHEPNSAHNNSDDSEKILSRHSSESYQSLADMMEEETENHQIYSQQMSNTVTTGTTTRSVSYGTLLPLNRSYEQKNIPSIMSVSISFVNAAWTAMDIAQAYHEEENEKSFTGFMNCVFKIWKVLLVGAESMLDWRSRVKLQAVV